MTKQKIFKDRILDRAKIEKTESLEEAIIELFGLDMHGRLCVLGNEAMTGAVAQAYDELGRRTRKETYQKIAEDFKSKTGYAGGTIVEVGCGSGLLGIALAEQLESRVVGIDLSSDMIRLAQEKPGPVNGSVDFRQGSVYHLAGMFNEKPGYVVCRNALHRFQYPELAIEQMYRVLVPHGKVYLRDLRRDADWKIVVKRIGEQRWQHPELVRDYIGAMAAMLTVEELEKILHRLGIQNYQITNGHYNTVNQEKQEQLKEFAQEVEYVCVIRK